jgi:hypothetical protein
MYAPVCATIAKSLITKTFANRCVAECQGGQVVDDGECPDLEKPKPIPFEDEETLKLDFLKNLLNKKIDKDQEPGKKLLKLALVKKVKEKLSTTKPRDKAKNVLRKKLLKALKGGDPVVSEEILDMPMVQKGLLGALGVMDKEVDHKLLKLALLKKLKEKVDDGEVNEILVKLALLKKLKNKDFFEEGVDAGKAMEEFEGADKLKKLAVLKKVKEVLKDDKSADGKLLKKLLGKKMKDLRKAGKGADKMQKLRRVKLLKETKDKLEEADLVLAEVDLGLSMVVEKQDSVDITPENRPIIGKDTVTPDQFLEIPEINIELPTLLLPNKCGEFCLKGDMAGKFNVKGECQIVDIQSIVCDKPLPPQPTEPRCMCNRMYAPVCATIARSLRTKVFSNRCVAECQGGQVVEDEKCPDLEKPKPMPFPMPIIQPKPMPMEELSKQEKEELKLDLLKSLLTKKIDGDKEPSKKLLKVMLINKITEKLEKAKGGRAKRKVAMKLAQKMKSDDVVLDGDALEKPVVKGLLLKAMRSSKQDDEKLLKLAMLKKAKGQLEDEEVSNMVFKLAVMKTLKEKGIKAQQLTDERLKSKMVLGKILGLVQDDETKKGILLKAIVMKKMKALKDEGGVEEDSIAAGQDSTPGFSTYAALAIFVSISGVAGYYVGSRENKNDYNILDGGKRIELSNYETI